MKKLLIKIDDILIKPIDFWKITFQFLWIVFFAVFNFFLLLKIEISAEKYTDYGYYFNYIVAFIFMIWSYNRIIKDSFLSKSILYAVIFVSLGIKYYNFSNDISVLQNGIILYIANILLQYYLPVIDFKKYNPALDIVLFFKIISVFYSFSQSTLFCKRGCSQDDFVLFYQSIPFFDIISHTGVFFGESFLFFVPVFGLVYIYKLYNVHFILALFYNLMIFHLLFFLCAKINYFFSKDIDGWGILMFDIYSFSILVVYSIFMTVQFLLKKLRG